MTRRSSQEVVIDQGLVSSRGPQDLPAFCSAIVEVFAKGTATSGLRAQR